MDKIHNVEERIKDSEVALELLKAGHQRYLNEDFKFVYNHKKDRKAFYEGQNPYAIVLACSDSRVVPEIIFDTKLGDIFVIRNAGNIVDDTVLASIEYAIEHLEVPLVVVLGHTHCGAVGAAESDEEMVDGPLKNLVSGIQTVIKELSGDPAVDSNAQASVDKIKESPVIVEHETMVVKGVYDIINGEIDWQ